MKIISWLTDTMHKLKAAGVDSPRRDSLVLLEDKLDKSREWVLAHPEYALNNGQIRSLNKLVVRRASREPLAYIRGKSWFYKRFFTVNPSVMIPRPESEAFITMLKNLKIKTVFDIGTGSGCLAVTIKLELPNLEVLAIDIDSQALKLAKTNAKNHKAKIKFLHGSLLEPISGKKYVEPTAIIANLPYVPDNLITSPEIMHEPKVALFSGQEGLGHYRKFWAQVPKLSSKPDYILVESLENQHKAMQKLAQKAGYKLTKTDVLVQLFTLI